MSAYMHFSTEISKRIIVWHENSQVSQSCEIGGKCLSNKTGFCVGRRKYNRRVGDNTDRAGAQLCRCPFDGIEVQCCYLASKVSVVECWQQ